jgi:hypothetical protein
MTHRTSHACIRIAPATGGGPPEHAAATIRTPSSPRFDRIGKGAAADGQPWPERHQMPGRRMALADADCALAGLRVALEMLLAAERVRQNGRRPSTWATG